MGHFLSSRHVKQLYSKKYGVHLARFTHKSSTIIYASTKGNGAQFRLVYFRRMLKLIVPVNRSDDIRYLSLHDNNYLRYFKGHKKR